MYLDVMFFGNGSTPYKYNGTDFTRHGIAEPSNTISAVTGGTAGGNLNGDYLYKVAYVNSYTATGDLSSAAVGTITAANEDVQLTSIPVAPQSFGVAQGRFTGRMPGPLPLTSL
jgi:hydroxyethylthiazole kinase-like sugar kinase family protein